jgi:acetyl esterase/lipase
MNFPVSPAYTHAYAQNLHRVTDVMSTDPMLKADADMRYVLGVLGKLEGRPIERCTPAAARRQPTLTDAASRILAEIGREPVPTEGVTAEELSFEGPEMPVGGQLYRPAGLAEDGAAPMILYLHAGGWVLDDRTRTEITARTLAQRTGAIVLAADYRLAPEHRFPAAHDDSYAAWLWLTENARALGGDPRRIAIVGEGVGGTMAVYVALQARAERQARPVHLALVSPLASNDFTRLSCIEAIRARPLNTQMLRWSFRHAFATKADGADPRVNLVARDDLGGLPPTTLILAEIDPLLSDGETLGAGLEEAGVPLDMTVYQGVSHDFLALGRIVNKAMFAFSQITSNLAAAFD